MTERHDDVGEAAGGEHARDLAHHELGALDVFDHRVALHALENPGAKWQCLGVGDNIHAMERKQIDVHVAIHTRAGAANVKVPAAERRIDLQFARVPDERLGRPQRPGQAADQTSRRAIFIEAVDILLHSILLHGVGQAMSRGNSSPAGPRREQSTSFEMGVASILISIILAFAMRATVTRLAAG